MQMSACLTNVFNIRLSCSFWDVLAQIYLDKYKSNTLQLANAIFLVPNRRACLALTQAFVRTQGLKPTILPQIVPIAEIDDEELFFNQFDIQDTTIALEHIISKEERLFLFSRLIMSKPAEFGLKHISLAQAVSLAIDLGNLIDTASNLGLSFDKLEELVPEQYATHWQETLRLLKIITEYWPQILKERNAVDASEYRKQILFKQAEIWQTENTTKNIVVAGITASFPAIVNMLQTIQRLPNGEIYFAGIDRFADDEYWKCIDESHPQFELKELLELLQISRKQINDIVPPLNEERERLISEIMRPATVSDKWQSLCTHLEFQDTIHSIRFINCYTQRDEGLAIALKIRQVLEIPEKTVALVTYDRNLARRVAAELGRFDVKVDDSAGLPLNLSPIGIYLRLIAEASENIDSSIKMVSLLKHPFTLLNMSATEFRKKAYNYEYHLRKKNTIELDEEDTDFINTVYEALHDFATILTQESVDFYDVLQLHIKTAEILSSSDTVEGKNILWCGDVGKCAAKFINKLFESAHVLGKISGRDYLSLFNELMGLESVRTNYGTHPRVHILGPIEARLHHFDYVILGEFNEGTWPKPAQADMWMSRPMKKDFGFSLPEKNIGILGADLCGFLASDNVVLTRAERIDGAPMNKSRWLLRLETVLKALGSDIEALADTDFSILANTADRPEFFAPIKAPAPCPDVSLRPRIFSASGINLLISDPYAAFVKYILKLYPLNDLDMPMDRRDYGTLVHAIIEEFNNLYPTDLPDNALQILLDIGKRHFDDSQIDEDKKGFWLPQFIETAHWVIEQEKEYRNTVKTINNEIEGRVSYPLSIGDITFTAKADRIDELKDGSLNIIDYKTGQIPAKSRVVGGQALQLLIEGLIARKNGFSGISSNDVSKMIYWKFGDNTLEISPIEKDEDLIEKCEDYLIRLLSKFDCKDTPYLSSPVPNLGHQQDYEHIARIKEWSVQEGDANGND